MKKFKYFLLGFGTAAIIFTNPSVKAADLLQDIRVTFSNMPIYIEGVKAQLTQKPMVYKGTTYLPMRTVAQNLGKQVFYDTDTRSTYIFSEGNEPDVYKSKIDQRNIDETHVNKQARESNFTLYNIGIGDSKNHVINELGQPDRQDASEYGFTWFIYNKDYRNYLQVGIKDGKVVGLYTNSSNWKFKNGITFGSSASDIKELYGTPLSYIQRGSTKYYFNTDPKEVNTFLTNDFYLTFFYDIHENQTVTSILMIDKNIEQSLNNYYGKNSDALIKAYELQVFDLANGVRVRNGLKPYTWDDLAAKSSALHSEDMAKRNYFSHTNLKGESPFDRMSHQGIQFSIAAENIAGGQINGIYAHEGWMNSKGHRDNILGDCKRLGVGVYFGGQYEVYYTQNFYTPQ